MLPALWVGRIEVMRVAESHGWTATAELEDFAAPAFLETLKLTVSVHQIAVKDIVHVLFHRADIALETATSHQPALGGNGEMTVATVTAVVNGVFVQPFGEFPQSVFIKVKRPKVVLEVEGRAAVFVLFELLPATVEEVAVTQRLDMPCFGVRLVLARGTIAAKGKNVGFVFDDDVNQFRNLVDVGGADGAHDGAVHPGIAYGRDFPQSGVERPRLSETVVRLAQAVQRKLVLAATEVVHSSTNFICEMERIAHQRKRDAMLMDEFEQVPKAVMQDGVASRYIKVWLAVHPPRHILDIGQSRHQLFPWCFDQGWMTFRKDITVLATLVASICYMPLECKIRLHNALLVASATCAATSGWFRFGITGAAGRATSSGLFLGLGITSPTGTAAGGGFFLCANTLGGVQSREIVVTNHNVMCFKKLCSTIADFQ